MTTFHYRTRRALLALMLFPALALTACDSGEDGPDGPDGFPGDPRLLGMWAEPADGGYQDYVYLEHDAAAGVLRVRLWEHDTEAGCFDTDSDDGETLPLAQLTEDAFLAEDGEVVSTYTISGSTLTIRDVAYPDAEPQVLTRSNRTLDSMVPGCALGADARIASVLQQTGRDGGASWEDRAVTAYSYDERGLLDETNTTSLQGFPGDEYRYVYTYDAVGRRTAARYINVNGEHVTLYRYDGSGRLSETRTDAAGIEDWDSMLSRSRYLYDARGLRERVVNEMREEGGGWEATEESRYSYNADETVREILDVSLTDGQETPTYRYRYHYMAGLRDRLELDQWADGGWALVRTTTYERDEEGRAMTETSVWVEGIAHNRYVYTWENPPGARMPTSDLTVLDAFGPFPGHGAHGPMDALVVSGR